MDVTKITISRADANRLYQDYKEHRHYDSKVDDEVRKAYREISKGTVVIQVLESIRRAGLDETGRPKLAIGRSDLPYIRYEGRPDGTATFMSEHENRKWRAKNPNSARIVLPKGSLPFRGTSTVYGKAELPPIPHYLRPRQALEQYHILFEALWSPAAPLDPYLLRRIGTADLWVVVAAWDLSPVERAALATRVNVQ